MAFRNLFSIISILVVTATGQAQQLAMERTIKVMGRKDVTITTPIVRLGDLAEVSSLAARDDDSVIGLQKIYIDNSPAPGNSTTLPAALILEKLTAQGVDLSKISYTFPRVLTVTRAARPIMKDEIRAAIESALQLAGLDVALKDVRYRDDRFVSPGDVKIEALPLNPTVPGSRPFSMKISVNGEPQSHFEVNALVDEWSMLPVAGRSVARGSLIRDDDVVMARVNLASLPTDAMHRDQEVIGLEANRDISIGEVFRKDKLAIPPVVIAGSKVTMMYKNGVFEASATGIALESGTRGQEVKIRNETSKKIISGTILEAGLVGVKP